MLPVILSLLLLQSCSGYDFKVNDRVVYTPARPFSDYEIPDDNLRACVEQHIQDASVTEAQQLKLLNCSHAGISSVRGLSTFTGLVRLRLSHNAVVDVTPLGQLRSLAELQLDHNTVENASPLVELVNLHLLDLSGNGQLLCSSMSRLRAVETFTGPDHC